MFWLGMLIMVLVTVVLYYFLLVLPVWCFFRWLLKASDSDMRHCIKWALLILTGLWLPYFILQLLYLILYPIYTFFKPIVYESTMLASYYLGRLYAKCKRSNLK